MLKEYMEQAGQAKRFRQLFEKNRRSRKRDHRKLGKEMDLFHFRESPGSVFWHEKDGHYFKLINYEIKTR